MKLALIRVRGRVGVSKDVERTLELLKLKRKHNLVIVDDKKEILGMIKKVEPYITYGEIEKGTLIKLIKKRGKSSLRKKIDLNKVNEKFGSLENFAEKFLKGEATLKDANIKQPFCLHPPRKGFERGGIKKFYKQKGALGYRGKEINKLIEKML